LLHQLPGPPLRRPLQGFSASLPPDGATPTIKNLSRIRVIKASLPMMSSEGLSPRSLKG
jgi:hypothetical protein